MGGDKSAQVPGMVRGTGSSPSADCPSVEACSAASNFVAQDMTYADGKLTGSMRSNLCPGHETKMRHIVPQAASCAQTPCRLAIRLHSDLLVRG